jgi:O6-methylguanine-DNA--protein-cysteine methyltransferase
MAYFTRKTKTLVGELTLIASDHGLAAILWQTSVWKALLKIPFGQTRTYSQIAEQIGRPTAARAVGPPAAKTRSRSSRPAIASSAPIAT